MAIGSTAEQLEDGSVKDADVDICGDKVVVAERLAVAEAPHDATFLRVELDELS